MKAQDVGVILLASGRSSRFGEANKLEASLHGRPLVHHAAQTLSSIKLGCRIVVRSRPLSVDWDAFGFEELHIKGGNPLSSSIAAGIVQMRKTDLKACLIALADMPFVPVSHFEDLIAFGDTPVLATSCSGRHMVPARFDRELWGDLETLSGDFGARSLLEAALAIGAPSHWLTDIDTPQDLTRYT